MSYQAIARKWRPGTFGELKGQESTRKTLINAVKNDRLHHALLFSGPRGTGKTSTARILSKILRCTQLGKDLSPCGKCKDCLEISTGRNLDVLEIDGASNNGVDSIRELRDQVSFNPTSGQNKIYIIDEVHMLSTSAFNALLKTLEEPPDNVYFMMATTEPHKLPKTILSRCQRYDFKPVPIKEVYSLLETICKKEGIDYEDEALFLIAQMGEGCVRDSLSFLDQSITFSEGKLTKSEVSENIGVTDVSSYKNLLKALIHRDSQVLISELLALKESYIEPQIFLEELVLYIKNIILFKVDSDQLNHVQDYSEIQKQTYFELSQMAELEDLYILFDVCFKGSMELSRAFAPYALLEVTLLKAGTAPFYKNLTGAQAEEPNDTAKDKNLNARQALSVSSEDLKKKDQTEPLDLNSAPEISDAQETEGKEQKSLGGWHGFVFKVKELNPIVGAKLENCSYKYDAEEKSLVIKASGSVQFMEDQIRSDDFLKKVQNYLNSFWGEGIQVSYYQEKDTESEKSAGKEDGTEKEKEKEKGVEKEKTEGHGAAKNTKNDEDSSSASSFDDEHSDKSGFLESADPGPSDPGGSFSGLDLSDSGRSDQSITASEPLKKSVQEQSEIDKTERLAKLKESAQNHEVVKKLVEVYGAKITQVDEL